LKNLELGQGRDITMERAMRQASTPLLILCLCAVTAQRPASQSSPTARNAHPEREEQQISFLTEDRGVIYADLYGAGDRGVVLAHGGQFNKESWQPQAQYLARAGFRVLAFDFRGFGQSHGPGDSDMYTAPMKFDVLAAMRYLRSRGTKTVSVVGASFGGGAAVDACIASQPGEVDSLVLLAAEPDGPADKIKVPVLVIVARDDTSDGPRLPRIRRWFDQALQPKQLLVLNGSAHAQFLFQTDQANLVMEEVLRFLSSPHPSSKAPGTRVK
jgi:pimeloyl-ACP methyl ester carboxylesterase